MNNVDSAEITRLEKLSKTARFLKKNNFQKLESKDQHFHSYTLTMKDEDLEYEWRLLEITSRKRMATIINCLMIFQDLVWTIILSEVDIRGKSIKIVIDVLAIFCLIQMYYIPRVKENKQIIEVVNSGEEANYTKWEIVQQKLKL
jgi:hypothetical protein